MTNRQLFLAHVGQTSQNPLCLEIVKAEGSKLYDINGKEYIDLIGGISVCNIGHRHPKVIEAIKQQLDHYLHLMVYGEIVQAPQVQYATLLADNLPASLNTVFFTASGTEATEGAMKLAKRYTHRTQIVAFKNSYHGSTQGALSIMGNEQWKSAFRPLLPDVLQLEYNSFADLEKITTRTACVIAETVQAEAGVIVPLPGWMEALRSQCCKTGALLVLDEIQCGFGRNGTIWGFEQCGIIPDILLLGKALGGGMPLGAFIADKKIMHALTHHPVLGHMNTFGGHPVCCAAGMEAFRILLQEKLVNAVQEKEKLFLLLLQHPQIKAIRSCGLMIAVEFQNEVICKNVIDALIEKGVFTDWFLFNMQSLRIAPPLTITTSEIKTACMTIQEVLNELR